MSDIYTIRDTMSCKLQISRITRRVSRFMQEFLPNKIWRQFATSKRTFHVPLILIKSLQRTINERPTSVIAIISWQAMLWTYVYKQVGKKTSEVERGREKERLCSQFNHDFFSLLDNMGGRSALIKMSTIKNNHVQSNACHNHCDNSKMR